MAKPTNELSSLEVERQELEKIRAERDRLGNVMRMKRAAALQQEQALEQAKTPQGLMRTNDRDLEDLERKHRQALRELAKAESDLAEYERGAGKDLDAKFADFKKREFASDHSVGLAALRGKLKEYLETGARMAELERERNELYEALGFRPPLNLFIAGDRANDWILAQREIASAFPDLFAADDPQRLLVEKLRRNDEYFRNPPAPEPIVEPPPVRWPRRTPAAEVNAALRGIDFSAPVVP